MDAAAIAIANRIVDAKDQRIAELEAFVRECATASKNAPADKMIETIRVNAAVLLR